jgi:hypothetical protein
MYGILTGEQCPSCDGTGRAEVGLIGFDLTWETDCPDCENGRVSYSRAKALREDKLRRRTRGFPSTPPSGVY